MSSDTKIKKITLEKLDDSSSKVKSAKIKRLAIFGVTFLVIGIGVYVVYGMLSGQTLASRFTVNNMNCPACVITVKEVTAKMPGIVETDVSLASQSVTVKFQEKRASAENIGQAIAYVGYNVKFDGTYKPDLSEDKRVVIAGINGKPLFSSDINVPLAVDPQEVKKREPSESFFSNVGKELILQAADKSVIVAQPSEVDDEIRTVFETQAIQEDQFNKWISDNFGSMEKFRQIVAQRLAIHKLLEDMAIMDIQDSELKKTKILEMLGDLFKSADVKIYDGKLREQIHAKVGHDDWKTFWPRMLNADSELRALLMGRNANLTAQSNN